MGNGHQGSTRAGAGRWMASLAMIPASTFPNQRAMTMSETLSETRACDLLTRIFRARGYAIARNVMFREYGVEFHADGWDAKARVGFEFLSSEDDDHDDLSLAEYQTLMAAQQRGELALFVIDEVEPLSSADLFEAAEEFLDEVDAARASGLRPRTRAAKAARGRKTGRPAAKRSPAKAAKPVKKKVAKKKAATKKAKKRRPSGLAKRARAGTKSRRK